MSAPDRPRTRAAGAGGSRSGSAGRCGGLNGSASRGGGGPAEGLAGPVVELGGDRGEPVGVVARAGRCPSGSTGAAARWCSRCCGRCHGLAFSQKNTGMPKRCGDVGVQRHLLALVPGQRPAQVRRQLRSSRPRSRRGPPRRCAGRQVQQDREPARPLDQGADRRAVGSPMIRSPSQCPGVLRSSASAGRWSIIVMFTSRPRRSSARRCGLRRRRPVRSAFGSSRCRPPSPGR